MTRAAGAGAPPSAAGSPPCAAVLVDPTCLVHGRPPRRDHRLDRLLRRLGERDVVVQVIGASGGGDGGGRRAGRRAGGRGGHGASAAALEHALQRLAALGIGPGLVVLLAPPASPAARAARGVARLRTVAPVRAPAFLHGQLAGIRAGRVPDVDRDEQWLLVRPRIDRARTRVDETVLTIGAHGIGTRGAVEEDGPETVPMVLAAGAYVGSGAQERLRRGCDWTQLQLEPPPAHNERLLDLRTGVLLREERPDGGYPFRSLRFAGAGEPGLMALRAEAAATRLHAGAALRCDTADEPAQDGAGTAIDAVAAQTEHRAGVLRTVERLVAYAGGPPGPALRERARADLAAGRARGFLGLLADHRRSWARRWHDANVWIPDDLPAQLGIRYALFQLRSNADRHDELAVGARGVSGAGYRGHVFWDADVFVLPALLGIDPAAARAMLQYRLNRLDRARAIAAANGCPGARFPWESASSGADVTPRWGELGPRRVEIRTGTREEHITADVAWAADRYATWTGDPRARAELTPLIVETARYWAGRLRTDAAGRAHIDGVIGPDEYHELVDDNAYTNVMARWNLRAGAELIEAAEPATARAWRDLAGRVVDGYDPATGRHEQFAGYDALEPLLIADVAEPPVAADVLLGPERVERSQLIKQPDVLMLHHVVPGELPPGSLAADLDFYLPRTAHGSSLSPATTASVLARAARPDEALAMLRVALDVDLDDTGGLTAGGLHMGNLGGVWQAVLTGFAGVRVDAGVLQVAPCLPTAWGELHVRFRVLQRAVRLDVAGARVRVEADGPLRVHVAGEAERTVRPTRPLVAEAAPLTTGAVPGGAAEAKEAANG